MISVVTSYIDIDIEINIDIDIGVCQNVFISLGRNTAVHLKNHLFFSYFSSQ